MPIGERKLETLHEIDRLRLDPRLKGYYYELINIRLSKVVRCGRFR